MCLRLCTFRVAQGGTDGGVFDDIAEQVAKEQQAAAGAELGKKLLTGGVTRRRLVADNTSSLSATHSPSLLPMLPTHQRVLRELHGLCTPDEDMEATSWAVWDDPATQIRAGYRPGARQRSRSLNGLVDETIIVKGIGSVSKLDFCKKHKLYTWALLAADSVYKQGHKGASVS
jgi:hypothetical protein